jgi:uncharacterized protein involved in exopolysaccharide biosynthesis
MREYWKAVLANWTTFVWLLVAFEMLAGLVLLVTPLRYESNAKIVASEFSVSYSPQQQNGLGAALAGASLLGLADKPASLFAQFRTLMTSPTVARRLLKDPELVGLSMFPNEWDKRQHRWKKPGGVLSRISRTVKTTLGFPPWSPPDQFRVSEYLSKNLYVLEDLNSIVSVSIRTKHAELGNKLLDAILRETAGLMREVLEKDLTTQIAFMRIQLPNTASVEARQAQISLVTDAEKKIILIQSGSPIGAQVIEPVTTDPVPVSPNIPLTIAFANLAAFALFFGLVLYRMRTGYVPNAKAGRVAALWKGIGNPLRGSAVNEKITT